MRSQYPDRTSKVFGGLIPADRTVRERRRTSLTCSSGTANPARAVRAHMNDALRLPAMTGISPQKAHERSQLNCPVPQHVTMDDGWAVSPVSEQALPRLHLARDPNDLSEAC
jgi:hypothetical protein